MDRRKCNEEIAKISSEIGCIQTILIDLEKQPGENTSTIRVFEEDLEFLENLKRTWENKHAQCTY